MRRPVERSEANGTISVAGKAADSGGVSVATLAAVPPGMYHWRAWAVDEFGMASAGWSSFGANGDDPPAGLDFKIPLFHPSFWGGSNGDAACAQSAGVGGSGGPLWIGAAVTYADGRPGAGALPAGSTLLASTPIARLALVAGR